MAGFAIGPLIYVVIGGFRTTGQLALQPLGLPNPWVISNYTDVLLSGTFWRQVFNSVLIAVIATVLVVGCGSLAAFALSRYEFRGREGLNSFFTLGLLFPAGVAILPLYLLLRNLHLLDTPWAVAIPQAAFGLPVTIIILRPFMRTIPVELEDAAMIDGCTRLGFFWRILLPLSAPALTTVGILAFVGSWNGYLLPLLVLSDPVAVHAAARHRHVLLAVQLGHREDPGVHGVVHAAGVGLLPAGGAADRRRSDRVREGLSGASAGRPRVR